MRFRRLFYGNYLYITTCDGHFRNYLLKGKLDIERKYQSQNGEKEEKKLCRKKT